MDFGVSRTTVRLALNALARRGLIQSRHGVGSFVSQASRIENNLAEAIDFAELIQRGHRAAGVVFDDAAIVTADSQSALALKLAPGDLVHRSTKRFTADGHTVIYARTSIPLALLNTGLAEQVAADPTITEPLFGFFDHLVRLPTHNQVTTVGAILGADMGYPTGDVDPVGALLEMEEVGYDCNNRPIWHSLNWYPAGAMSFQLVRQRGGQ
jgi:GntR family transcriptional regulator